MGRRRWQRAVAGWLVAGLTLVPMSAVASEGKQVPLGARVRLGAYVHLEGRPYQDPVAPADLAAMERQIGRLDIVHYFFTWGRSFGEAVSPNLDGRDLMLTMKPDGDLVERIAAGDEDGYLDQFAADARDFGRPVYLRFGHEMNGAWMSYSAGHRGGPTAEEFKAAWRRLSARIQAVAADNVKLVWSPNEADFPDHPGNRMEDYWPGEDLVDIAGFDAYNWSMQLPRRGDGRHRTFVEMVEDPYERLTRLTGRPIWLCEFGTVEPGKGRWLRDMFATPRFPRLSAVVYFSENDQRDVQRDWRLDSSSQSVAAWRAASAQRS